MSKKESMINKSLFNFVKNFVAEQNRTESGTSVQNNELYEKAKELIAEIETSQDEEAKFPDDDQSQVSASVSYQSPIESSDEKDLNKATCEITLNEFHSTETLR